MDKEVFDLCEVHCIHEENVREVRQLMIDDNIAGSLALIFKTMGDSTRVKLIFALMNRELCVCDLAAVTGNSESSISHHLRLLRNQKLVKFRREGKVLYYSLSDDHIEKLFLQGMEHVNE